LPAGAPPSAAQIPASLAPSALANSGAAEPPVQQERTASQRDSAGWAGDISKKNLGRHLASNPKGRISLSDQPPQMRVFTWSPGPRIPQPPSMQPCPVPRLDASLISGPNPIHVRTPAGQTTAAPARGRKWAHQTVQFRAHPIPPSESRPCNTPDFRCLPCLHRGPHHPAEGGRAGLARQYPMAEQGRGRAKDKVEQAAWALSALNTVVRLRRSMPGTVRGAGQQGNRHLSALRSCPGRTRNLRIAPVWRDAVDAALECREARPPATSNFLHCAVDKSVETTDNRV
jgi:hypothetical protein